MDQFIEVVGSAATVETLVEHRVALTLTVRAPQSEDVVQQAAILRDVCVKTLLGAGLKHTELSEGGGEIGQVWWWRTKKEREKERDASHKVLIACADIVRIRAALAALEPCFRSPRLSLDVTNMTPRFDSTDEAKIRGQQGAVEQARTTAAALAKASGVTLGRVIQVEELDIRSDRSGAYGDEDYGRMYSQIGDAATDDTTELDPAKRKQTCRYRVRFGIAQGE